MINEAMFTSKTNEWATPQAFFDELDKEFNFTLDPCATPQNAKCARYLQKKSTDFLKVGAVKLFFAIRRMGAICQNGLQRLTRKPYRGKRLLLCLSLHGRTLRIFTITYTKNTKCDLFAGGYTSTKANVPRRFRQWLL